jgi:hypothetical protein
MTATAAINNRRPYSTSFRLSERARSDLAYLADWRRVSMTDVIEQLIAENAAMVRENRADTDIEVLDGKELEIVVIEENR